MTYLYKEIDTNAILGPFKSPPIENLHMNPFMTQVKSSSVNRRVIFVLNWPIGRSVNSGVGSDTHLGTDFVLTYSFVYNITDEVLTLGKGCQIFKVDISRDLCHIPVDPEDLDLLGLHWKDYFLDFSLTIDFKHGLSIFQGMSDVICFIMRQDGHGI